MVTIISSILLLIGGLLMGFSSGMGLQPIFKQPKNITIQITLGIIGLVVVFVACKLLDIL